MPPGFFTACVFSASLRAAVLIWLACFSPGVFAQVSDGEGLTPLEGVVAISDDRALWDAVKDSRDVNDFRAYLNRYPKGLFAEIAVNRIRVLGGPNAPPPAVGPTPVLPRAGQTIKDCADCPEMVVIPAGSFEMGSNENADERPVRRVNVPSFLIGKTEVTQGQWKAVMGSNPSRFSQCGDDCPVEQVSWNDVQEFAKRMSQKTGKQYRLPSEAEWEYAARAGSNAKWSFGDVESQLGDYAWYSDNIAVQPQRVAQKKPNSFGLYDIHGNVLEWVQDCYNANYNGAPNNAAVWATGCMQDYRVLRGGSWYAKPPYLRSAYRSREAPTHRNFDLGFRLARQIDKADLAPPGSASQSTAEAAVFEAAVKLAVERVLAEVAQKAAAERAASEAAPKPTPLRTSNLANPGQIVKDCADCPEMVVLPAGSFEMGSNENTDERPVHRVNVPSFLIGKTEVTQGQWKAVMGSNPSSFSQCGDDCPVERVTWNEAQDFARRLSQKTGKQYRLPSEAEWEYAARAGSSTKWSFGDSDYQLGDYAWFNANSQNKTQRVGQKKPNAFGLYDMHGNVWEWVEGCWHGNYAGAPTDGSAWTTGCNSISRVLRGGSWINYPAILRSAFRSRNSPDNRLSYDGLRLARTP